MMLIVVLIAILVVGTLGVNTYARRAERSLGTADKIWRDFIRECDGVITDRAMAGPIAELVYTLGMTAGCGCYVRQALFTHYMPEAAQQRINASLHSGGAKSGLEMFDDLSHEQRKQINKVFVLALLFDSFANPVQGWLFRRALRNYRRVTQQSKLPVGAVREAQSAALKVAQRKYVRRPELCAA